MVEAELPDEVVPDIERLQVAVIELARNLRVAVPSDLNRLSATALAAIVKFGPLSVSELAAREGVIGASMSRTLGQLLADGYVTRSQNGPDGRVALVSATPEGRARFLAHRRATTDFLRARLRDLGPEDLAAIRSAAAVLERLGESTGYTAPA